MLIADDHRLFAEALEAILSAEEQIEVIGHARDGREAVDLWQERRPDVMLMDIAMPVLDGIAATREIRALDDSARILMLTGSNARSDVDRARAGRRRGLRDEGPDRGRAHRRDHRGGWPLATMAGAWSASSQHSTSSSRSH